MHNDKIELHVQNAEERREEEYKIKEKYRKIKAKKGELTIEERLKQIEEILGVNCGLERRELNGKKIRTL